MSEYIPSRSVAARERLAQRHRDALRKPCERCYRPIPKNSPAVVCTGGEGCSKWQTAA